MTTVVTVAMATVVTVAMAVVTGVETDSCFGL